MIGPTFALQIGYASEFSFAKAFKRTFGIAPGTYRGQRHGVPGLGRDLDAAILPQDATGLLSVRLGHPS
jgi:AraC-like DNA-binding protein